ncbi:SCO family protein [Minwuia sp.]|uniref:SCO family protein n=1 Tax=Minwuia sp. TaxID=2493630 RepID=UPI003A950F08
MKRSQIAGIIILVIAAVVGVSAILLNLARNEPQVAGGLGVSRAVPVGGPFTMTDHTGQRVTEKMMEGRYSLIYFGYTFCPDVCPTELQDMAVALDLAGEAGKKVTPVFVTVDPSRDGQEEIAAYVEAFHPRMIGLRGTEAETTEMASAYRVFYTPVEQTGQKDDEYYLMDHSNFIYLMGPDGKNIAVFNGEVDPQLMAEGIRQAVKG